MIENVINSLKDAFDRYRLRNEQSRRYILPPAGPTDFVIDPYAEEDSHLTLAQKKLIKTARTLLESTSYLQFRESAVKLRESNVQLRESRTSPDKIIDSTTLNILIRALDLLIHRVGNLKNSGYSDEQILEKLESDHTWSEWVVELTKHGIVLPESFGLNHKIREIIKDSIKNPAPTNSAPPIPVAHHSPAIGKVPTTPVR